MNLRRIEDLAYASGVTSLLSDTSLLEKLKAHDRVNYDIKTGLFSYKVSFFHLYLAVLDSLFWPCSCVTQHEFNFRNKAALLTEIQRQTRKGSGISVRPLKEVWKEAPTAVEELEEEGEVFVTRTQKDGQLKMVFWNEIKPNEDEGGMPIEKGSFSYPSLGQSRSYIEMGPISLEFCEIWHSLKVPADADLLKQLDNGLSIIFLVCPSLMRFLCLPLSSILCLQMVCNAPMPRQQLQRPLQRRRRGRRAVHQDRGK